MEIHLKCENICLKNIVFASAAIAAIVLPFIYIDKFYPNPNYNSDLIITTLGILVTLLIGWQIISVLTIERKVEEIRNENKHENEKLKQLHFSLVTLLQAHDYDPAPSTAKDKRIYYCKLLEYLNCIIDLQQFLTEKPYKTIGYLKSALNYIEDSGPRYFEDTDHETCDKIYNEILRKKHHLNDNELRELESLHERRIKLKK